jgi:4-hydroxybenzoate polyprenyltransferase
MRLATLTRSHEWWDHKTPQVLSLAYGTAILANAPLYNLLAPGFLMIFASLIAIAIYASIINDFTDLEIDRACGKSNMMDKLKPGMRLLLLFISLGLVLTAAAFIYPNIYGVVFYLLIAVAISLYSFEPVRFKKRGIWGIISCASAEHFFPVLFSIAVITWYSNSKIDIYWLGAAGELSLIYGIRSILWHQFLDKENDVTSGICTFAANIEPVSFKKWSRTIIVAEWMALLAVLFYLQLWLPVIFLLIYVAIILLRDKLFHSRIITVITPKESYFQLVMLDYYSLFFPISLLIYSAFKHPNDWIVLVIHLILFHKILWYNLKDGYYISRKIIGKLLC